jgi:dipeptidyl aminopeptidase/acylaminoacyl peptidase
MLQHLRTNNRIAWTVILAASLPVSLAFTQDANGPSDRAPLRPGENLTVEGIPEIPAKLVDSVSKYTEARAATAMSWHPRERSLLISTRFGNSNQIHRVSMPGGARYQLTFYQEPVGSAEYDPLTGDSFLFSRDVGGNEFAQIYRYDLATGNASLLTDGGRSQNGGWVWNRAQTEVCYTSTRRNGADRDIWVMNPQNPASNRMAFELKGGGWSVQDWSIDDQQVLIVERLSVNKSNIYMGDISTGKLTPLNDLAAEVAYREVRFTKDGKAIFVLTDELSEFQQLAKLDLATAKLEILTPEIEWDIEAFQLNKNRDSLAFAVNRAGLSEIYLMSTQSLNKQKVAGLPIGVASLGPWRDDGSEFAITINAAQSSSDVYSINAQELSLVRWTESEMGGMVPAQLAVPKLVEWKSFDNQTISGFLYQPPASFTGKRPVIINIHGGPEGQSRPVFQSRNNYFINELGCAILYPNVRGSTGYGKSFMKMDNGLKRFDSVRDIGALLDWIERQPALDSKRVMITGGSYGGYMTLACAVEYNTRIACALDVVGISHFATFLKNTESYRRDLRRVEYGDERIPEVAAYFEKIAPLNNAQRITKPLFVVQGGNDPRVPLSEAEQMVAKVKNNGGSVWYLMANDEGHGFRKKSNADFQFYATILFIERYLTSQPN